MKNKISKSPKWLQFEKRVGHVLTLSGYSVEHDCLIGGGQTDLFATKDVGPILTRILVECKHSDTGKAVSINDVENFCSRIIVLRNQDLIDGGILVANTRFTKNAKSLIKNSYIELTTVEELNLRIFDFRPYLLSIINDFEKSKLNEVFINPKMANAFIETEHVKESDTIDMLKFFKDWSFEEAGSRLCLLGDYGAGKTSFCQKFNFELAKRHLNDPKKNPIPLLVPLHKYTKAINIKSLMTDFIVNDCRINNFNYDSFDFLLKSGRFLLLLDGFDEMARHVDKEVRYQTISELSKIAKDNAKVLLTGRPGYFPSHDELMQIIAGSKKDDLYHIARDAYDELVDYEPFEIQPFNLSQIQKYIKLYIQNEKEARKVLGYIKTTYNLLDLATRPVLLEMVVKSLPKLLALAKKTVINAATLYDVYTKLWIDREEKKGDFRKLIKKHDKLRFMEEVAYQLFQEDKNSVTYKQLTPSICEHFGVIDCELDYFANDIRTCSFLFRTPIQGYLFIHRSFQEFFVAKKLMRDLKIKNNDSWKVRNFPKEILRFLSELLIEIDHDDVLTLSKWASYDPKSITSQNSLLILLLTNNSPADNIEDYYGLPKPILQSYAYLKLDDHPKTEAFTTFLYKDLLDCYRKSERLSFTPGVDGRDIVHDAFYRTLAVLKRQSLMPANKIISYFDYTIYSSQKDIERSTLRQKGNEIVFSDLIDDMAFQGYEIGEDTVIGKAQYIDEEKIFKELIEKIKASISEPDFNLFLRYYINGESIIELSKKNDWTQQLCRVRLHRLRKTIAEKLKLQSG